MEWIITIAIGLGCLLAFFCFIDAMIKIPDQLKRIADALEKDGEK
jgi:hypothetical protein